MTNLKKEKPFLYNICQNIYGDKATKADFLITRCTSMTNSNKTPEAIAMNCSFIKARTKVVLIKS